MNKEKLLRNFLYYLLTASASFIVMFIISLNYFDIKGAFLLSFFYSLILGWFLIGALTIKIIEEISKDIKNKNKKNIFIWIILILIFIPIFINRIQQI
ncbi:MAG: hypothetical protein ACRDCE_01610 [Cetobacterium sp.]|uniref:hypothetical protein n=1 Tax=Cetobacterium sp. TaxID=2071632 RepID=UPI003EE7B491